MDQLIKTLEQRIETLLTALSEAHEEIQRLRSLSATSPTPVTPQAAQPDLLAQPLKRSTEDRLQLYIEESLDLLPLNPEDGHNNAGDTENQLCFDLGMTAPSANLPETFTNQSIETMTQENQTIAPEASEQLLSEDANQEAINDTTTTLSAEQKRRQKNQKNNRRLIRLLEERYPKAFDWNNPRPLKVGIDKDMELDDNFNASKQRRALATYTRSDRYKKCLLTGQPRIDLNGTPVSDEPALPNTTPTPAGKVEKRAPAAMKMKKSRPQPTNKRNQSTQTKPTSNKATKIAAEKDDPFANLSAEERMKAKLEKLLGKH
ncbi:hypothetical protein FJM67_09975 [Maribrevibacterium harenarium]|uniref:ProQ/FinO domain-containing protein n=1 Tax=Maribrevibacterium harenarium TaxID=2589817 RepID=A0A501WNH6_9GAMM|nr:ProQ/FinO family protein [Maribrevibacterium harenarium]TPE50878.1 hypothetical protein FJM67_09975 [Maribrevibacterium harenarium]